MLQPIKKNIGKKVVRKKKQTTKAAKVRAIREKMKGSQEYGTSKLEERFSRDFLDKLGVKYTYQYKMSSIGRYLDFMLDDYRVGIEVDGDYFHSNPMIYEEKSLSKMQKHNKMVDEVKNKWCSRNGIPLIRIWEYDINHHPEKVLTFLKEKLNLFDEKKKKEDNLKKRH